MRALSVGARGERKARGCGGARRLHLGVRALRGYRHPARAHSSVDITAISPPRQERRGSVTLQKKRGTAHSRGRATPRGCTAPRAVAGSCAAPLDASTGARDGRSLEARRGSMPQLRERREGSLEEKFDQVFLKT